MKLRSIDALTGRGLYSRSENAPSPNIVFITYDMVPREFWEETSEEALRGTRPVTPALDLLGNEARFGNAWCTSPLCSPSRASILTGRYSYLTTNEERAHDGHEHQLRETDTIFPEYLKSAGYVVRHVGKCHVGAATFARTFGGNARVWDRWCPPWYDDDDYLSHLRAHGLDGFRFSREIFGKSAEGERGNFTGGWVEGKAGEFFPEAATYTAFTADQAIKTLDSMLASGKPFYQQIDFFEPHQPFAIPGGLEAREKHLRERVKVPESWRRRQESGDEKASDQPRIYDLYRKYWGFGEEKTVVDYLVAHILQFEVLERQTLRILQHLKDRGVWENTVIVLTADHGEMNGEEALIDKGAYLNPRVLRVPLVAKGLKLPRPTNGVIETPVSLLDLAPTFLQAAGIQIQNRLDGLDLASLLAAGERPDDKPILFEVWTHVMPNPSVGMVLRFEGQEYCCVFNSTDDCDELYRRTPEGQWPLHNLVHEPAIRDIRAKLRRIFLEVLESDTRWVSWSSFFRLRHREDLGRPSSDLQRFVE